MSTKYVRKDTAKFYKKSGAEWKAFTELLWGDRVQVKDGTATAGYVEARARGLSGWIKTTDLGTEALLELYFIDVGQGDGVLICTPDGRHILIDGGYKRASQPSGKNAADFVDWKFVKDYGQKEIKLEALIASHNDADHYGGLWDLINPDPAARKELNAETIKIDAFYHAGVSWWTLDGKRSLGRKSAGLLTDIISDRQSILDGLATGANPKLQGDWAKFMKSVTDLGCPVQRLSDRTPHLPGFAPGQGDVVVRVLGPVEKSAGGKPALPYLLSDDSQSTNGNSIVLRLDYGGARLVLTGDLNTASQALLLQRHAGEPDAFACDVVKSCHHGSGDCSLKFLQAVNAGATVISSGDAESHAHPRPEIVAASACTGHIVPSADDKLITPLIYSTEISRSHRLGRIVSLAGPGIGANPDLTKYKADYRETTSGALQPRKGQVNLAGRYLVAGLIYGLVNVRTDGETILCATMDETGKGWVINKFKARF